jgi:hypothetical protein
MKIKPLDKNDNKIIKIKLLLLLILIATGFLFPVFFKKPKEENQDILGKTTSPVSKTKELEKQGNQIKDQILGETTNFVNQITSNVTDTTINVASQAGNTISSLIYDAAVKPIIDQIQRLPKDQQEKVKEQICK